MGQILDSAIVGVLTGIFSAGAVWGVLSTELRYLRRDIDEIRKALTLRGLGVRHVE